MLIKALVVGLLLAFAEVVNGNIRVRVLHRLYGQRNAKIISLFTGLTLIYAINWYALLWIEPSGFLQCLQLGLIWLLLMLCLDIFVGRYLFKYKWHKILDDFNLSKGNLLSVGMLLLFISPSLIFWLQM